MNVGIYARVSTDEQAREGYSIAAQLHTLNAWAVVKGATSVTEYVDEGFSAKNMRRPNVQRLLADCMAGRIDMVIVWKLDRLSRNLRDLLVTIEDIFNPNHVELVSATEQIDTATPRRAADAQYSGIHVTERAREYLAARHRNHE